MPMPNNFHNSASGIVSALLVISLGGSCAWTPLSISPSVTNINLGLRPFRPPCWRKHTSISDVHNPTPIFPFQIKVPSALTSSLPNRLNTGRLYSTSTSTAKTILPSLIESIDKSTDFPALLIGKRIGSGSYGTVHEGFLIQPKVFEGKEIIFNNCYDFDIVNGNDGVEYNAIPCIAKRPWSLPELENGVPSKIFDSENENVAIAPKTGIVSDEGRKNPNWKERASRCMHYWNVERHCFQKLKDCQEKDENVNRSGKYAIPTYYGVFSDVGSGPDSGMESIIINGYGMTANDKNGDSEKQCHRWMVFEKVGGTSLNEAESDTALSLLDAMELDWKDQRSGNNQPHHLYDIQKAMNLPDEKDFGDVLDAIFRSLLEDMVFIHSCNIVHRDLKPGNLLCDAVNQRLRLIDFGSAADLDPSPIAPGDGSNPLGNLFSGGTQRVGLDEGIVAVSPVYAAPETFIKPKDNPLSFDVFSAALIMCQLIFNLLDERTDAGFHQKIENMGYDLDLWLERELGAKLRPAGFDDGLEYLGERRGLWGLLKKMFKSNPLQRISSKKALEEFDLVSGLRDGSTEWTDEIIVKVAREEAYFETVIESFERCEFSNLFNDDDAEQDDIEDMPRPLHFVASFKSSEPVGLVLAEAFENVESFGCQLSGEDLDRWAKGTKNAFPGEVFIKGFAPAGQAEQMGIFEIGDRLRGVGELPFVDGGFEKAIAMINKQPQGGKTIRLHFDRLSKPKKPAYPDIIKDGLKYVKVGGQGAWKSKGRRNTQEDAFVLHEVYNRGVGNVLIAGVFDGHGGTAASESVSRIIPSLFADELTKSSQVGSGSAIRNAMEQSWETVCNEYRNACDENGECIAEYDPIEGILFAETGSKDLVAGTTSTMAAISMNSNGTKELTILNCGDSRTLLIGQHQSPGQSEDANDNSVVVFSTRDHSPDDEKEIHRLERGIEKGLDYSLPMCSMNQSFMVVGDYQYALCRSLEGSFATSKGIVSDPDVTTLNLSNMLADRQNCALVLACDGIFEVMSNEEVGREVVRMRQAGYAPGELAKNLCGQAMKKGSYDNISVIVIYLDEV
mmetsp:Transcript_13229/g.27192  ORF Transcript_13229/g.27192 Transcript_13229/m.27192 type:complete len:1069 (-) Transcript_13229:124-3330(-)